MPRSGNRSEVGGETSSPSPWWWGTTAPNRTDVDVITTTAEGTEKAVFSQQFAPRREKSVLDWLDSRVEEICQLAGI